MDDYELKCAAIGIITYMFLLNAEELPDFEVGDLVEIGAELDDDVLETTMAFLSTMDMDALEMYELPFDEDDDE